MTFSEWVVMAVNSRRKIEMRKLIRVECGMITDFESDTVELFAARVCGGRPSTAPDVSSRQSLLSRSYANIFVRIS